MALRTSWLARPPTAAANGGRVPLAVLDRQRTNSVFTGAWKKKGQNEKREREKRVHAMQVQGYQSMRDIKLIKSTHFVSESCIHFLS